MVGVGVETILTVTLLHCQLQKTLLVPLRGDPAHSPRHGERIGCEVCEFEGFARVWKSRFVSEGEVLRNCCACRRDSRRPVRCVRAVTKGLGNSHRPVPLTNMAMDESHVDPLVVYAAHSFADDQAYQVSRLSREQYPTS